MRSSAVVTSLVVAALSLVGCKKEFTAASKSIPVNVSVRCVGDSVFASIRPYSINVYDDEIVEWVLDSAATVGEIEINEKQSGKWPFGGNLPYKAKKNEPGKGKDVLKSAKGQYEYVIETACTMNGEPKKILIDPDMIIIRGTRPAAE